MRFFKLKINITNELQEGYYLRSELDFEDFTLLGMIKEGNVDVVDEPICCELITNNGFRREIHFRDFRQAIEIPVYEGVSAMDEIRLNTP